ncbi:hypothetical protein S7711_02497 [Stachybotrys chartarum IBT 7711]|uniref:Bromo domain-containing protein n=1 Tax=Stachybotrys chartarum (strain CBS 109288 / IBT 7711) TaxID=1280523 RepID=A0A084B580_STACB|nr:hypothetical protein S7711_02497 [Stachybotrys chartarum IBT 7711]KFA48189.1 hypothetical protein S40293_07445 [Stachybotrys chartarum IBT 40293]KFA79805.1 hypothetical protein S40288_00695 [Stachybotrys chartarum IBT 40288]
MASPAPDASAPSPKPEGSAPAEETTKLNGHASLADKSPAEASKPDAPESTKSLINGSSTPSAVKDDALVNGAGANDVPPTGEVTVDKADSPKPEGKAEETKDDALAEVKGPESPVAAASTSTEEIKDGATKEVASDSSVKSPPLGPSEDVDMIDAALTAAEPEPKKADVAKDTSKEDVQKAQEPKPDIEMVDETEDEPASTEKSDAAALPISEVDLQPASLSQLAIDSTEPVTSPAAPSVDVSMAEVMSAKVSREREDDIGDEPAPKRARTEPKDDESAMPMSTPPAASDDPTLASIPQWSDAEVNARSITPFQRREIRRIIDRIKKTKAGGHFRDAVVKLWPGLRDAYLEKIDKPMDLGELNRNLKEPSSSYPTYGDFRQDLALIFENAWTFNGPAHDVTRAAWTATRALWVESLAIQPEEPQKPKSVPKAKPLRESRIAALVEPTPRRQSTGPASSPAVEAPEPKAKPPPIVRDTADDVARRASLGDIDRPKRTVRAPKPKDIDYSTKASRKKLKPELQFAEEVLGELTHTKHVGINGWFLDAVDAEGLNIPNYYSVIKKPMDLGKVSRMLANGEISSLKEFDKNVRLIFGNCYQFNGAPETNPVSALAKQLEDLYVAQMKGKDAWLARHAKANAPTASASNASDDDEDAEDEGDGGPTEAELLAKVKGCEARLQNESRTLNSYFIVDNPDQNQIDVQQIVVKAMQDAVLTAKQELAQFRQKQEKVGKKGGKPTKTKAVGGAASRKSGGALPGKKPAKKASQKKILSAADKDAIAAAINDLEYPHLEKAIDIIKKDTDQEENNDGELELDIDQLSPEALLKLWELLRKVLPGFGRDAAASRPSPEVKREPKQSSKAAPKSNKKNKPMTAQEQEARISQLKGLQKLYQGGDREDDEAQSAYVAQAPTPTAESSEDSDSEEE